MNKRQSNSSPVPGNTDSTGKPDAKRMFAQFDTDCDGALSQTELKRGFADMRAEHEAVRKH